MDIIVVDDEPKIRSGLVKLIASRDGWNLAGAFGNAMDAFEFMHETPVDVIITDIKMPEMSGLELIGKIRGINSAVQIIILSGYSEFAYAQKAIELNVLKYMTKPTNMRELILTLESVEVQLNQNIQDELATDGTDTSNFIVAEAVAYIETNYGGKITLKDMADALYISPNYLCRLFKRHMNKNLMEYVTEYRMNKAKRYLKDSQYKISDIAEMVGYSDSKYFSGAFKKMFDMTPMEFRNKKLD